MAVKGCIYKAVKMNEFVYGNQRQPYCDTLKVWVQKSFHKHITGTFPISLVQGQGLAATWGVPVQTVKCRADITAPKNGSFTAFCKNKQTDAPGEAMVQWKKHVITCRRSQWAVWADRAVVHHGLNAVSGSNVSRSFLCCCYSSLNNSELHQSLYHTWLFIELIKKHGNILT